MSESSKDKEKLKVSEVVFAFAPSSAHVRVVDFDKKSADFCAISLLTHL